MKTWSLIILAALQVVNYILGRLQSQKEFDAGYNKAIAEEAAKILKSNQYAKQAMANINSLSADDTDKLLQQLEPKT